MKHNSKQSEKARKNLIAFGNYKDIDFYYEDGLWYLCSKDNYGLSAWDVYKNRLIEIREENEE